MLNENNCNQLAVCRDGIIYAAFPDHGLFKSYDEGKTWKELKNGLDSNKPLRVVADRQNPDYVYVATVTDKGVYGSTNGGKSFKLLTKNRFNKDLNWPMNYRQHEAVSGMTMFIDPMDPETLFLDYNKKTHDGGKTWMHYGTKEVRRDRWNGTGLTLLTEYRAVFDPNRPGIVWMGFSDTGLMLSEDNGESIINVPPFHRGEVNQAAGFRDRLVNTSGSCQAIAVDQVLSSTVYATISMKNATNRASAGGILIKTVDGGWNWQAIYTPNGLPDGAVRSINIDPNSPIHNRTIYVASYGNGVYKSKDDGHSFFSITPDSLFGGNKRLMDLAVANSNSKTVYLAIGGSYGIRPITLGPDVYPELEPGMYGGVFKTVNGGVNWMKCNQNTELPSVQDICIDPENENIVYAAVYSESYLNKKDEGKYAKGGLYTSYDGGLHWELTFEAPDDSSYGKGEVCSVVVNPVAPEIIYIAVQKHGIFRSMDSGKSWSMIDKKTMDRKQRRYHSINLNPHHPAEVWVAHFGSSFSKITDVPAEDYLLNKFRGENLAQNGGFEEFDAIRGFAKYWNPDQPPIPPGEKEVISIDSTFSEQSGKSIHFKLSQAYTDAPSPYLADHEQRRLQQQGVIPVDSSWMSEWENTGETRSWITQKIDPYFVSLARGKDISIEMDIFIKDRNLKQWWGRGYESGEIERNPPQLYLTEVRDYNINWMVAETSLKDLKLEEKALKGRWIHVSSEGSVSTDALGLNLVLTGVGMYSGPMDIYVDNISLKVKE